jgi:hypothetical protein
MEANVGIKEQLYGNVLRGRDSNEYDNGHYTVLSAKVMRVRLYLYENGYQVFAI